MKHPVDALPDVLQAIGRTPLVCLRRVCPPEVGTLHVKLEFLNPGGSVKDRAAMEIILRARSRDALRAGQAVVEMTSGNMGAGLAVVCGALGHPLTIVTSAGCSRARREFLESFGVDVVVVPQKDGSPEHVTGNDMRKGARRARAIARETGAFFVNQLFNADASAAHEQETGPEILAALGDGFDAFVTGVGSGGTFLGVARAFARRERRVACFAVEPAGAQVLSSNPMASGPRQPHRLQGIGFGIRPPLWDGRLCDGTLPVSDAEAQGMRRRLAHEEGLNVGLSSAANVCGALQLMASGSLGPRPSVVTLMCDSGRGYGLD